ncbi:hypothetical protein Ancab_015627 [Ancistrocladus abbreviatus]
MSWCKRSWITFVAPEKETAVSYSRVNLVTYHIMSRQLPLLPSTAFIAWVRTVMAIAYSHVVVACLLEDQMESLNKAQVNPSLPSSTPSINNGHAIV